MRNWRDPGADEADGGERSEAEPRHRVDPAQVAGQELQRPGGSPGGHGEKGHVK